MEAQGSFGATMGSLNQGIISRINFPLPPLPIQRKIAGILSAYDELIENNNRRIAILEKMAEEIYREWFVRMRFPGNENVKVVKGVPEGWEVKKVGDIGKVVTGKTPPTINPSFYNGNTHSLKLQTCMGICSYLKLKRLSQKMVCVFRLHRPYLKEVYALVVSAQAV